MTRQHIQIKMIQLICNSGKLETVCAHRTLDYSSDISGIFMTKLGMCTHKIEKKTRTVCNYGAGNELRIEQTAKKKCWRSACVRDD